jgi:hypothetical protein
VRVGGVGLRATVLAISAVGLLGCGIGWTREELPPVKSTPTPERVCIRPTGLSGPSGWEYGCGVKVTCDDPAVVVVRLDAKGRPTEAFVRGQRSGSTDACVLRSMRTWTFIPAMDCGGNQLPSDYEVSLHMICDPVPSVVDDRSGES